MRPFRSAALLTIILSAGLLAQSKPTQPAAAPEDKPPDAASATKIIRAQFGPGYKLLPAFPPMTGDFDGDGVPDLVLVVHMRNPLVNALEYHYKVLDPYYDFFGYGDPKVTMSFDDDDPRNKGMALLIIHGTPDKGWRAETPKAKFVIINVPFAKVTLSQTLFHKKPIAAIAADETDHLSSLVFWNGKKYKYEPNGASEE